MKSKVLVSAPPNLALVKYWGKKAYDVQGAVSDDKKAELLDKNIPTCGSISITLKGIQTFCEVGLKSQKSQDTFQMKDRETSSEESERFLNHAKKIKKSFGIQDSIHIESSSDFPVGAGIASSSSSFAALTLALSELFELGLQKKELSSLAREGSGSAARSFHSGYVSLELIEKFKNSTESFWTTQVSSLCPASDWPLECHIWITDQQQKKIGSSKAMKQTQMSCSYYEQWKEDTQKDLDQMAQRIAARDFSGMGLLAEENALRMHATMIASSPTILYWNEKTVQGMKRVWALRDQGLDVYFTIDAGPQLKILCPPGFKSKVTEAFSDLGGSWISCGLGEGARVLESP